MPADQSHELRKIYNEQKQLNCWTLTILMLWCCRLDNMKDTRPVQNLLWIPKYLFWEMGDTALTEVTLENDHNEHNSSSSSNSWMVKT